MTGQQKHDADLIRKLRDSVQSVTFKLLRQNEQKLVLETLEEAIHRQVSTKAPRIY